MRVFSILTLACISIYFFLELILKSKSGIGGVILTLCLAFSITQIVFLQLKESAKRKYRELGK